MGIVQKFKELVGIEEIDEEYEEEDQETSKSIVPEDKTPDIRPIAPAAPKTAASASAASVQPRVSQTSRFTSKDMILAVYQPQSFEESPRLVDNLKAKKPVIINLENLETDVARKIFDFLSGATYALNGNVQKVANNIFVFAPLNVEVTYSSGNKASEQAKSPWRQQ